MNVKLIDQDIEINGNVPTSQTDLSDQETLTVTATQEAAAKAFLSTGEKDQQTKRLFFEGSTGQVCRGITEWVLIKVGPKKIKYGKGIGSYVESVVAITMEWRDCGNNDNFSEWRVVDRTDANEVYEILAEKASDYESALNIVSILGALAKEDPELTVSNIKIAFAESTYPSEGKVLSSEHSL